MKRKPHYILTGAYNGLLGLAAVLVGSIMLYEYSVRLMYGVRGHDELFIGLSFLVPGCAMAYFAATTIRKFTPRQQEVLLDSPEQPIAPSPLTRLQKVAGILVLLATVGLAFVTSDLIITVYERAKESQSLIPVQPQTYMVLAAMALGVGSIPFYVIGTFRTFRKRNKRS